MVQIRSGQGGQPHLGRISVGEGVVDAARIPVAFQLRPGDHVEGFRLRLRRFLRASLTSGNPRPEDAAYAILCDAGLCKEEEVGQSPSRFKTWGLGQRHARSGRKLIEVA